MLFSPAFLPLCLLASVLAIPSGWAAAPAVPLGVAMVANSADSITLAWYRPVADDAKSYHVYASDKSDGTFKRIATVTERTATHGKLTAGTNYFYKVSAANADGESEPSKPVPAFTITPSKGAEFPVKIAKNMCVSLGATVISSPAPVAGKLADLVDGSDATTCRLRKACEIKIQLKDTAALADVAYLLIHFRTHGTSAEWSNDSVKLRGLPFHTPEASVSTIMTCQRSASKPARFWAR